MFSLISSKMTVQFSLARNNCLGFVLFFFFFEISVSKTFLGIRQPDNILNYHEIAVDTLVNIN